MHHSSRISVRIIFLNDVFLCSRSQRIDLFPSQSKKVWEFSTLVCWERFRLSFMLIAAAVTAEKNHTKFDTFDRPWCQMLQTRKEMKNHTLLSKETFDSTIYAILSTKRIRRYTGQTFFLFYWWEDNLFSVYSLQRKFLSVCTLIDYFKFLIIEYDDGD